MGFFGNSMPGYGGGMFPADNPFGVPDYMGGINEALAQNAALGQQQQPKKGFGEFLRAWAGSFGDSLTGNPVYASSQQAQTLAEQAQRKQEEEKAWWYEQQQYKAANEQPDLPGIADEYNWYSQQPPEMQQQIQNYMKVRYPQQFTPPSPVSIPYGATVEGAGGGPQPGHVEDGYRFKGGNPGDPNAWEPVNGGPSPGGSGGFPRPY